MQSTLALFLSPFLPFFVLATLGSPHAHAADELTTRQKLVEVRAMIGQQNDNVRMMRAELARNPNAPDGKLLRNAFATATGSRSPAYHERSAYMRALIDAFESSLRRNVGGAVALGTGLARTRAQFIVEIDRSSQFIGELQGEELRLVEMLTKEGAPHVIVEVVDAETGRGIADAVVTARAGGVGLVTNTQGECKLIKGTHIADPPTVAFEVVVAAKGYQEVWQTIPVELMQSDAGRFLVQLTAERPLPGTWRITQQNANGGIYTGTLTLSVNGDQVGGRALWDNHVAGLLRGRVTGDRVTFTVEYPGDLVGTYTAILRDGELTAGSGHDNRGNKPCTWSAIKAAVDDTQGRP